MEILSFRLRVSSIGLLLEPLQRDSLLHSTVSHGETSLGSANSVVGARQEQKGALGEASTRKLGRATIEIEVLHGAPFSLGGFHLPSSLVATISDYKLPKICRLKAALYGALRFRSWRPLQVSWLEEPLSELPFALEALQPAYLHLQS